MLRQFINLIMLSLKISIPVIIGLLFTSIASAQRKPNPKIGKNEIEINSFVLADQGLAWGGQLVYRFSWRKKLKLGAGGLYGANYDDILFIEDGLGYGAAFADIMQFIGIRQKWSFGGQIGHGFYKKDLAWNDPIVAGIYYSISCNYRTIVSKKHLMTTALMIGYRNFHFKNSQTPLFENIWFLGIKTGIVF